MHNIFTSIKLTGPSEPWQGPLRSLQRSSVKTPLKFDLRMHPWETDADADDDDEGRARVREVRSVSYSTQSDFSAGAGINWPMPYDQLNGLKATRRSFHLLSDMVAHLDKIGGICFNEDCISQGHQARGSFQPLL